MYYTGMSVRDIADHYEMMGIDVCHKTVYNWIDEYSKLTTRYINGIVPRVGSWFRADEVWVKIAGKQCCIFASMDDDTRYWLASDLADNKFQHNADSLLQLTKLQAGKSPRNFITDGLPAYMKSSKKVFGNKTNHVRHIHLAGKRDRDNNNKMERLNGEIRDREKVFRGLKKMDTSVLPRCTFADPTRHLRYFPRSFTNESAASTMHATNSIMVNPFPPANPSHLDSTSMNTAVLHRLYSMTDI